jgi:predicted transcriptional regulator
MAKRRAPAAPKGRGKSKASEALEKNILDFIRLKGQAKTAELKKELGVTDRTINRYQKKLLAEGRLEKVGNGKLAAYRLRGPSPETLMKGEALAMPDGPARAEFIEEAGPVQGSNPSNQGME